MPYLDFNVRLYGTNLEYKVNESTKQRRLGKMNYIDWHQYFKRAPQYSMDVMAFLCLRDRDILLSRKQMVQLANVMHNLE